MKMEILEEARKVPYEPEGEWIERKDEDHDHFEWDKKYLSPLRELCKKVEKRFAKHVPEHVEFFRHPSENISDSIIGENMGIEVVKKSKWKKLRKKVPDKQLYDFVLFEGITVHLIFFQRCLGYTDMSLEEFSDHAIESKNITTSVPELSKTYKWLKEREIPEELNVQQDRLSEF